jgi:lysophospholipid acyltransferase (LPLAT)-like uncharacterized protein
MPHPAIRRLAEDIAMNLGLKSMLRRDWVKAALCSLLATYIRFVHATSRWDIRGGDIPARLWDADRPFILAFWHGRLLMMPYCWRRGVPIGMLISQHPDGQFISHTIRHFKLDTIIGSSSRGGATAMRAILKSLNAGVSVGFTPDGPRGPRMRASVGIVQAARLTGMPILPCTFAVRHRRVLGSWDRFILALPFTRGNFIWGEPITVARHASADAVEAARQLVEDRLNTITAEADRLAGVDPIEPAPAPATSEDDAEANVPRAMTGRS